MSFFLRSKPITIDQRNQLFSNHGLEIIKYQVIPNTNLWKDQAVDQLAGWDRHYVFARNSVWNYFEIIVADSPEKAIESYLAGNSVCFMFNTYKQLKLILQSLRYN